MDRFTISLDEPLAKAFDEWIAGRGYANRSEAVRDLLRAELARTRQAAQPAAPCVACLSYVFNHHERELTERITQRQHAHHELTVAAQHVHLDHDHRLETVILKGSTAAVQRFADAVCAERGVHQGSVHLISLPAPAVAPAAHAQAQAHRHAPAARGRAPAKKPRPLKPAR